MRQLTKEEIDEILKLRQDDVTDTLFKAYFGRKVKDDAQPRFNTTDFFMLPENACAKNLKGWTTIGTYLFNRLIIEVHFTDVTGYINKPVTGKLLGKIYDLISEAYAEDVITADQMFELIDSLDWLGGGDIAELINISLSNKLFILPKEVKKRREELFKKYEKEIADGDVIIGAKIEQELVELSMQHLKNLPEWDNYASDSKLNFDNNFKTVMLMKGPILNTSTGEWQIAKSNYDDGIKKEEYALFADSAVYGTFQRAKGVQMGGYVMKKFIATLQDIETADAGSDCGTKEYMSTILNPAFRKQYMYMYIIEGENKLTLLTPKNFDKYANTQVRLRSPMYCRHKAPFICNKCVGEQPYKMNLKMIGLASAKIGSTLRVRKLKAFHNKKVYIYNVTVDDLLF